MKEMISEINDTSKCSIVDDDAATDMEDEPFASMVQVHYVPEILIGHVTAEQPMT